MKRSALGLVLILGATIPLPASADDSKKSETNAPTAEELAAQAYDLFQKAEYPQSIALYSKAYQVSAAAPILFNIASIYDRKLHERDVAAEYYRRYLRAPDTEPELVRRANERLTAMKHEAETLAGSVPVAPRAAAQKETASVVSRAASPSPPPPVDADTGSAGRTMRITGVTAGALGLVGLGVGAAFGMTAKSKNDEAATMCSGAVCRDARGVALIDEARAAATVSTVSFVVGGIALVGGALMYLLAPDGASTPSPSPTARAKGSTGVRLDAQLGRSAGGFSLAGTF